jgi:hypothetical protein
LFLLVFVVIVVFVVVVVFVVLLVVFVEQAAFVVCHYDKRVTEGCTATVNKTHTLKKVTESQSYLFSVSCW